MSGRRTTGCTVAGLLAAALASCATSTAGVGVGSASAPTKTARPTAHERTVPMAAQLLASEDIGGTFRLTSADGSIDALPCTTNDAAIRYGAAQAAGIEFVNATRTAQIDEQILRFAAPSAASGAFAVEKAGYACPRTELPGGDRLDILGPTNVKPVLTPNGIQQADAWQISYGQYAGVITVIQLGDRLVMMHFLARVGTNPAVNPQQVIETALAKSIANG